MAYCIAFLLLFLPTLASACAVCFGGADGNLIKGFTWGVAFLAVLPFVLMVSLITMVVRATKKNNHHE